MLRGRWNEVVERLSSISRVTWSMVGGNAQLGAVDGSAVVLLFPVEAMVNAFSRGSRAADVEKAIREVTGLTVTVSAQVGQASGGPATTGPSAQASRSGGQPRQPQRGGWVSEPPPFDEAAAQAAYHEDPAPDNDGGWPEPARAPEPARTHERTPECAPERTPEESAWPAIAAVIPLRRETPRAEEQHWQDAPDTFGEPASYESASTHEKPAAPERPALPERAARALAQASAKAPTRDEHPSAATTTAPAAPRKHSFTVFTYPGDPDPADEPSVVPAQANSAGPAPASSPVFDDAPIESAAYTPTTPTGWGDPVATPGGAPVTFDDGADQWTPPRPEEPTNSATPTLQDTARQEASPQEWAAQGADASGWASQDWSPQAPQEPAEQAAAPQPPSWLAAAPEPMRPAAPDSQVADADVPTQAGPGNPLTGRAAAEAALREKAEHETTVASTRTHAADDDSASIDDENIEHSQTIGLAAVLEILGGRVIEEKMTEGGY